MGLKDKLKQRAAKSPPRTSFEVYSKVQAGDTVEMMIFPTIHSHVRCGYHKPKPPAEVYVDDKLLPVVSSVPAPFYLKFGEEFLEIPVLTTDAGALPLCDRCANQLKCLERGSGDVVTPKDI